MSETSGQQRGVGRARQGTFQLTALHGRDPTRCARPPGEPEWPLYPLPPRRRHQRAEQHHEDHHGPQRGGRLRMDRCRRTSPFTFQRGVRNVFGNAVGLGGYAPVTVAIDVPRGASFLASPRMLARYASWFQGMPGPHEHGPARAERPAARPLHPQRRARLRQRAGGPPVRRPGQAVGAAEPAPSGGHRAGGEGGAGCHPARTPCLPAPVHSKIAEATHLAAQHALPGLGLEGSTFHFLHVAGGGARLVKVVLKAERTRCTPQPCAGYAAARPRVLVWRWSTPTPRRRRRTPPRSPRPPWDGDPSRQPGRRWNRAHRPRRSVVRVTAPAPARHAPTSPGRTADWQRRTATDSDHIHYQHRHGHLRAEVGLPATSPAGSSRPGC